MEKISKNDLNLINDLCDWKITKNEFKKLTSFRASYFQLNELLEKSKLYCAKGNINRHFDSLFWSLPKKLTSLEKLKIYRRYLLVDWHHEHEEIAGTFQVLFNDDKENIPILIKAVSSIPKYLQSDGLKYSYIRKIIYAIGAQPEPYNIEALEKLAKSFDEQIRELALHQIEKRGKSGRWEAKKNAESSS